MIAVILMLCIYVMKGAISRTMAQTLMHPANTYKTLLQMKGTSHH